MSSFLLCCLKNIIYRELSSLSTNTSNIQNQFTIRTIWVPIGMVRITNTGRGLENYDAGAFRSAQQRQQHFRFRIMLSRIPFSSYSTPESGNIIATKIDRELPDPCLTSSLVNRPLLCTARKPSRRRLGRRVWGVSEVEQETALQLACI